MSSKSWDEMDSVLTPILTNSVPRLLVARNTRLVLVLVEALTFKAMFVKYSLVTGWGAGATSRLLLDEVDDDDEDDDDDDDDDENEDDDEKEEEDDDDDDAAAESQADREYWE